jgi:hypothetical protein
MQWRTGQCSVCHQTLFRSFVLRDQFVAIVLVLRKQGALTASTMRAASCWCELFGARWDSVSLTSFSVIASRMYAFSKCSVVWQSDNTVRRGNAISRPRACATLIMAYRSAMSSNLRRSFAEVCSLISCTHDTQLVQSNGRRRMGGGKALPAGQPQRCTPAEVGAAWLGDGRCVSAYRERSVARRRGRCQASSLLSTGPFNGSSLITALWQLHERGVVWWGCICKMYV